MAARLPYIEDDDAPPEVREFYDAASRGGAPVPNFFRLMAHHARSLPLFQKWYRSVFRGPLDLKLRQLAYVRASQLNGCGYCVAHNAEGGVKAGVPEEKFAALAEYGASPLFSELERRVIAYAEEMTENVHVEASTIDALKEHLSNEAIVQLTISIAAANFTNRFNEALGTELEK